MSARWFLLIWLLVLSWTVPVSSAEEPTRAIFRREGAKVQFWQTNFLSRGTGGVCVVDFCFYGGDLKDPIENLTLAIRIIDKDGTDLGVENLMLFEPLGGYKVASYQEAKFDGVNKWPLQEHGELSPLCYDKTRFVVESAIGKQSGNIVDLVRFGQLEFTTFRRVNIKVKK